MKTDYSNTSMLDIVFEHRNKNYGAYVLRRDYNKSLAKAVTITLLSAFLLISSNFIVSRFSNKYTNTIYTDGYHDLPVIEIPKEIEKPQNPEPPKPNNAKSRQTIENTEKNVVAEDRQQTDSIPDADDLKKYDSGLTTNMDDDLNNLGVDGGKGKIETPEPESLITAVHSEPKSIVEKMPKFPGGEEALMRFLHKMTSYPDMEQQMGMEGKAVVKFVVNEDGSITNATLIRSDSPGFGKEALKVVTKLPKFEPGMQQGKPVKVYFVLPFVWKQTN
jgi:protein TonB